MHTDNAIHWSAVVPAWLAVALVAAVVVAALVGAALLARRGVDRGWIAGLTSLRLAIALVFAFILFAPGIPWSSSRSPRPELLILVDSSRSMAMPSDQPGQTRWQAVQQQLTSGLFADALRDRFELHWFTGHDSARPLAPNAEPAGSTTDLSSCLESAWKIRRALGGSPARVLLASDGVDHGGGDPLAIARRLGLTIDVLPPGETTSSSPRTEIVEVQSARRALIGAETSFRLTVRRTGPVDREASVPCTLVENGETLWTKPLTLKAGIAEQHYTIAHRPMKAGRTIYDFRLNAPNAAGIQRTLDVVDRRFETLFLEDTWRWEFKFLHRLLQDDPALRSTAFLARGGGAFEQFASPDRRVNLIGFPQNRGDLERFDVFVLGDVQPSRWPAGLGAALGRLIAEEGKSLIVLAGPNLAKLAEEPELHAILPVELNADSGKPVEGPIEPLLRPEASRSPLFFQLSEKLPLVDRVYPAVRRRPAATVLMEAAGKRNAFGNLILMAEQPVGAGRVLFVGTDTLWKWQTLAPAGDGPTPYAAFWQQAFRALTPLRSSIGAAQVWLTPERTHVEPGRPIRVTADVELRQPLNVSLRGHVELPDKTRLPLVFRPDPADSLRFHAEFASNNVGQHVVATQVIADGNAVADETYAVHVNPSSEDADTEIDLAGLTRLAAGSGGSVIVPSRPETWPRPDDTSVGAAPARTINLWDNASLLLLLTCLLAADWVIRLRKGLVS